MRRADRASPVSDYVLERLRFLGRGEWRTANELAEGCNYPQGSVAQAAAALVADRLLVRRQGGALNSYEYRLL